MELDALKNSVAGLGKAMTTRQKVDRLQDEITNLPQVDCPVRHYFAPGLYAREITIPAGTALVGAVHKVENLAVLSSGRMLLVVDDGTIEVMAPYTLTCKPGGKNAAVALETSVWTNFLPNPTNETDVEKLAEMFTESKASDLLGGLTNKQLAANKAAERLEA